jgi:hypothetical protein
MSEARTEDRLGRLEQDVGEIKAMLTSLMPPIHRIDGQLPHLATKAELTTGLSDLRTELAAVKVALADKPGRGYLWGVMAAMVGAQAVVLAAAALIFTMIQPAHGAEPQRPYSCRLLDDAQRQCAFSQCDPHLLDRLRKECLRDGGRP